MFRASAGQVDLSPPIGGEMIGFIARLKPAAGRHDPITARAVMLDDGVSKAVIVSCDVLGFDVQVTDEMRRAIADACRIDPGDVLICCTHTHSGPASLSPGPDDAWLSHVKAKIAGLARTLLAGLRPARFAHASTTLTGIGYNRQSREHPIDETLGVLGIDGRDGRAVATIINYSTHAVVLGPENLEYSADFPGAAARYLAERRGGTALYLQGACGDVNPAIYRDRGWGTGTFNDVDKIGRQLAEAATDALGNPRATAEVSIRAATKVVNVPLDEPPSRDELDQIVEKAEADCRSDDEVRRKLGRTMLTWAGRVERAVKTGTLPTALPIEIFALAINDLRLVGLPFEAFTDIGLGIREGLAPLETWFVGYANGYCGYCPTGWGKDIGGYGGKTSCRYGFGPLITGVGYGADELLIRECVAVALPKTAP